MLVRGRGPGCRGRGPAVPRRAGGVDPGRPHARQEGGPRRGRDQLAGRQGALQLELVMSVE